MKKEIAIFLLLVAIMAAPKVFALEPTEPHNADAMWVEPSQVDLTTASVGYKFNVTLWANSSIVTTAWQFLLHYNTTYLNATGCWYTAGLTSEFFQGLGPIGVEPIFYSDSVLHAESVLLNERAPGYGSLSFVEFEVIEVPTELVTFELDITTAFPEDTYIMGYLDGDEGKLEEMDVYNCQVIIPEFTHLMFTVIFLATSALAVFVKKKAIKR